LPLGSRARKGRALGVGVIGGLTPTPSFVLREFPVVLISDRKEM
jgi:hypothetical protein